MNPILNEIILSKVQTGQDTNPEELLSEAIIKVQARRETQYPSTGELADWVMKSNNPTYATSVWQAQRDAWVAKCIEVKSTNPIPTLEEVNAALLELGGN